MGIEVVRRLRQEAADGRRPFCDLEKTDFEECALSGLALLDVMTGYDTMLIVDTIKKAKPQTGRVRLLEADDLRAMPGPSPHYVSIPQTIEIGRKLGLHVPSRIQIVAVEAKNMYQLGEGLTPEMTKTIPMIIATVKEVLRDLSGGKAKQSAPDKRRVSRKRAGRPPRIKQ